MDVRLPDGRIVNNVPEGTGKRDLVSKLRRNGLIDNNTAAEWLNLNVGTDDARRDLDESLSTGQRLAIGAGRGAIDTAHGAKQLALEAGEALGLADEGTADAFTREAEAERDLFERGDLGAAGTIGRIAGAVGATAIPGGAAVRGAAALGKGSRLAASIASSSPRVRFGVNASAGGAGGAAQFVGEEESRAVNAGQGAIFGAIGGEVVDQLSRRLSAIVKRAGTNSEAARVARANTVRAALAEKVREGAIEEADVRQLALEVADGFTLEQAIRKVELERVGVTPTRGRVSGDLDDLRFEVEQSRVAGPIADLEAGNRKAVVGAMDERVKALAGDADVEPGAVGENARDALSRGRDAARKLESEAFDAAGERVSTMANTRIEPTELGRAFSDDVDFIASLNELAPVSSALKRAGIIDANHELVEGATLSAEQAEVLRRVLGRVNARGEAKAIIPRLRRALEGDVVRDVGEDVFADARAISAERFATFDNRAQVSAIINGRVAPERVVQRMTSASTSADDVRELLETLDAVDDAAGDRLRAAVLDDVFSSAKGAPDLEGTPHLNPASLRRRVDRIGERKLTALYGEDATRDIIRFTSTLEQIAGVDRRVANPGTAAELTRRAGAFFGRLLDTLPGSDWVIGAYRAVAGARQDVKLSRQVARAMNVELLARENRVAELLGDAAPAPASAAGLGSLAGE